MSAYSGDDSEEARAKVQELRLELSEARDELEESEYDKYISDQSALLDSLYSEYELILNTRLDNQDALMQQIIDSVNAAAVGEGSTLSDSTQTISKTITDEANSVGAILSDAMESIWSVDGDGNKVVTKYGEQFSTKLTTVNTTLNGIKTSVDNMVISLNKEATSKVESNGTKSVSTKTGTATVKKTTSKKISTSGDGKPDIGDKVTFKSGKYYYDAKGKKPLGSKYLGKQVYITNVNDNLWATHPYHISTGKTLGKGDLGWLKLSQLSGYATGKKKISDNEIAWTQENGKEFIVRPSDGAILTPVAKGDSVLNSNASKNIWDMANSPADFIKNNLGLSNTNVPNGTSVNNTYTQNIGNVVFDCKNIKSYDELLSMMQKDRNFEKLILSMSVDRLAGKSSLAKNKAIR